MPKLSSSPPKYRHHRATGQAAVTIAGRHHYLGPYGTKASKLEYDRLVGEWLAGGRPVTASQAETITVVEMLARYWRFAQEHFRKDGQPTRELENIRNALKPFKARYGHTRTCDFGPLALKAMQLALIDAGLSRGVINANIGRIKRVFKWAVSEELVAPTVLHGLQAVSGLQRNRTRARETEPVAPVSDEMVELTLPHMPPVVADMVRLQRLLGCRPGEIRMLRPGGIDRSGEVWSYKPGDHKMRHRGRERVIFIGPQAQDILAPYLLRAADALCFQPIESEQIRKADLRARRKSKVQPSQRSRRKARPKRQAGDCYSREDYARAIRRACDKAWPLPENLPESQHAQWRKEHRWSPNQLRHARATEIRKLFGLEGAQTVLGHSRADVTQIYAERDLALASEIMRKIG